MLCLHNMHRFDAVINVVIFENSLPLGERRFYRNCGVGKDLKYRSTSAPLPPCTCLPQAGLRQTRRLQDLGISFLNLKICGFTLMFQKMFFIDERLHLISATKIA